MEKIVNEDIRNPDKDYAKLLKVLGESSEAQFWYGHALENYGPSARILEFGAGAGNLAIPLARAGLRVTAVEADSNSVQYIKEADTANLNVIHGMVEDLELDTKYDLILAKSMLLCMPRVNINRFFNSAAKHLSSKGTFFAEVLDEKWLNEEAFFDNGRQCITAQKDKESGLWIFSAIYRTGDDESYRLVERFNVVSDRNMEKLSKKCGFHLDSDANIKLNPITKLLAFRYMR